MSKNNKKIESNKNELIDSLSINNIKEEYTSFIEKLKTKIHNIKI